MTNSYLQLQPQFTTWDLADKKVFLRADLNVPVADQRITDDSRLHALLPTLDYLLNAKAHVTIATHLGRPKGFDPAYSTKCIAAWFTDHGYTKNITVLENLRFSPEELQADKAFAQKLAHDMDFYVNDAFASVHRPDTSLTVVPTLFDSQHKSIGFLIAQELRALDTIKTANKRPFVVILGGGKAEDKINYIEGLLPCTDHILLCPEICEPFWAISNPQQRIVRSYPHNLLEQAQDILGKAQTMHVSLHIPQDYLVGSQGLTGTLQYKNAAEISAADTMIAIGPQTVELWKPLITQAQTIFFNGPMGNLEDPRTTVTLKSLLSLIAQSSATCATGGGSSLEALRLFNLNSAFTVRSSGGGASLAYLSGQRLPALDALLR